MASEGTAAEQKDSAGYKAVYVREREKYAYKDMCAILGCNNKGSSYADPCEAIEKFLSLKPRMAIITKDSSKDVYDEDSTDDDSSVNVKRTEDYSREDYRYSFIFVGIIEFNHQIIMCYPKYLMRYNSYEDVNLDPEKSPGLRKKARDELRLVLKVLRKYSGKKDQTVKTLTDIDISEASGDVDCNLLDVMMFLLDDYYENGIYSNTEEITELNGMGEIDWNRTINENIPVISDDAPYYMELYTINRVDDEYDFFTRLHKAVLTDISSQMIEDDKDETAAERLGGIDVLSMLEYPELNLTEETLEDFGVTETDSEYVLSSIDKELGVQFNTRKQLILKAMYVYISHRRYRSAKDDIQVYGTSSFNLVWEAVCSAIYSNMLGEKLRNLSSAYGIKIPDGMDPGKKLEDVVEMPLWHLLWNDGETHDYRAAKTLEPDTISIIGNRFCIYDAKYYIPNPKDGTIYGQPGIESITKQYLYQQAYARIIRENEYEVENWFLFPTDGEGREEKDAGGKEEYAELGFMKGLGLGHMNQGYIKVRFIRASKAYECYITGRKYEENA